MDDCFDGGCITQTRFLSPRPSNMNMEMNMEHEHEHRARAQYIKEKFIHPIRVLPSGPIPFPNAQK